MGNAGSAILWNSVPYAESTQLRREPSWAYYSQVSVASPHERIVRNEARSTRGTLTPVINPGFAPVAGSERQSDGQHTDEDKQWGPWSLTQRELEVLQLLAEGATNNEISERLFISPKTTKNHLAAIFQKLDVTNRTHALVRAVVMGLVSIE